MPSPTVAVQVVPLTVAPRLCPLTTTVTPAMPLLGDGSLTVPVRVGVLLLVVKQFTVTAGGTVSRTKSPVPVKVLLLPALSVAVTLTS